MQAVNFNPNDTKYKACCCHAKTFTIVVGILEIFTICFILVAVLPDLNSRICEGYYNGYNETSNSSFYVAQSVSSNDSTTGAVKDVENFICELNVVFLIWAVAQIVSINVMFYGIKIIRWFLFVPHILFRLCCAALLVGLQGIFVYFCLISNGDFTSYVVAIIFLTLLLLFWLYATWIEIRCAHFIKRSQETGFSISVARPIGPATISLSEREAPPPLPVRQLPPLRHTRNPYVTQEKAEPHFSDTSSNSNNLMNSEKPVCFVCGDSGDGHHFGVSACRACAAFFRRTVARGKNYFCRETSSCCIDLSIRSMCKACRYNKCLAVGMRRSAVQKNREPLGNRGGSISLKDVTRSELETRLNSQTSSHLLGTKLDYLERLVRCYDALRNARLLVHADPCRSEPRIAQPTMFLSANSVQMKDAPLVYDFIQNTFPELSELDFAQKEILFKNCFPTFGIIEGTYNCMTNRRDVYYLANGDYIDYNNPAAGTSTDEELRKNECGANLFKSAFDFFRKSVLSSMINHGVLFVEMLALLVFVVWDVGLDGQNEKSEMIARKVRETVMRELLQYYSSNQTCSEPSVRMGNLMLIPYTALKSVRRFQENVEISRIFDLGLVEGALCDLIVQKE
ncbi:unnamed protein product [Caenorhabditis auriculariae]|uniref:Nuclear receptor domain-containing protein n=1 Tax=Caenorhabditis auriculariae TaxID=2777116 RepID=A0A8S1H271_9PELO|nr:unnamed protein product [Caenorhabditis auriculariae]